MSQLLQVRTITEVIDRRIAQFSTGVKDLPVTTPSRTGHLGSKAPTKLKPLDHAPGLRTKADDSKAPKFQLSPLPKSRTSLRSTTTTVLRKSETTHDSPPLEKALNSTSVSSFQVDETNEERGLELWTKLLAVVIEQGQVPLTLTPGYRNLHRCLLRLKFTVRWIEGKQRLYLRKVKAATRIQAWVRGFQQFRRFVSIRYAVFQIQRYWKQVCRPKNAFQRIRRAAKLITAWWR